MKFNFKIQQYQTDAVGSIVKVFAGQPYQELGSYHRDIGNIREVQAYSQMSLSMGDSDQESLRLTDDFDESGFKNESVLLSADALLKNIRDVQQENKKKKLFERVSFKV